MLIAARSLHHQPHQIPNHQHHNGNGGEPLSIRWDRRRAAPDFRSGTRRRAWMGAPGRGHCAISCRRSGIVTSSPYLAISVSIRCCPL
jgi:hypothetical protein